MKRQLPGETRSEILDYLAQRGATPTSALADHLGCTKSAVSKHLRELIEAGAIVKIDYWTVRLVDASLIEPPPAAMDFRPVEAIEPENHADLRKRWARAREVWP